MRIKSLTNIVKNGIVSMNNANVHTKIHFMSNIIKKSEQYLNLKYGNHFQKNYFEKNEKIAQIILFILDYHIVDIEKFNITKLGILIANKLEENKLMLEMEQAKWAVSLEEEIKKEANSNNDLIFQSFAPIDFIKDKPNISGFEFHKYSNLYVLGGLSLSIIGCLHASPILTLLGVGSFCLNLI
jgi:hypothetical protein